MSQTDRQADRQPDLARLAAAIAAVEGAGRAEPAAPDPLPEDGAKALAYLVRSTSQRPLTAGEARAKLAARDHDDAVIDAVIARATTSGLLDDHAFAAAWVNDRGVNRGYGRDRLRRELRKRKVDDAVIETALLALDEVDEVAQATELARDRAQRMPADLDPPKVAQRLVGFLVRRGYASDVAHQVARRVTALDRDWD